MSHGSHNGVRAPDVVAALVLHDWWGLGDLMDPVCNALRARGLVVSAPDLYAGRVARNASAAGRLMNELTDERLWPVIERALNSPPFADASFKAVFGFGLGAWIAMRASARYPAIDLAIAYEPIQPHEATLDLRLLNKPTRVILAGRDTSGHPAAAAAAWAARADDYLHLSVRIYDAPYGFHDASRSAVHDRHLAEHALHEAVRFLHTHAAVEINNVGT